MHHLKPTNISMIVEQQVNQPPVADPDGPYTGIEDEPVRFDGTGSFDPDGTIVRCEWNFGDGTTGMGMNPVHTYTDEGTYTVTLTVTDDQGAVSTDTTSARIQEGDDGDDDEDREHCHNHRHRNGMNHD